MSWQVELILGALAWFALGVAVSVAIAQYFKHRDGG